MRGGLGWRETRRVGRRGAHLQEGLVLLVVVLVVVLIVFVVLVLVVVLVVVLIVVIFGDNVDVVLWKGRKSEVGL